MEIRKDIQKYRKEKAEVDRMISSINAGTRTSTSVAIVWLLRKYLELIKP